MISAGRDAGADKALRAYHRDLLALQAWRESDVVVLDTREPADFAAGHLAGSLICGRASA